MSVAEDIRISSLDIPPHAGIELTDARLRLHDFLNNPRPVGKIDPEQHQMADFIVEEGYGDAERQMFSTLGSICMASEHGVALNDHESLLYDMTEYGDPVYSISRKASYEGGPSRVVNLIAVEGLFLFGHEHFAAVRNAEKYESEPSPLRSSDYDRFKSLVDSSQSNAA